MAYDFHSAGAAAGEAVTKLLDEQRTLKRQAMIDELNRKQVEAGIANTTENTRSLAEQRQAQAEAAMLKQLEASHPLGSDVSDLDPAVAAVGKKYGMFDTSTPQVSASEAMQDPTTGEWGPSTTSTWPNGPRTLMRGSAKEQQALQRQVALRAIMDEPNIPKEMKSWMQIQLAGDDFSNGIPNVPTDLLQGPDPIMRVTRGGVVSKIGEAPHGAHIVNEPAPQQPTAATQPSIFQAEDPDNPGKYISYWLRSGEQPSDKNKINTPLRKGNPPNVPANKGITPGHVTALRTALNAYDKSKTANGTATQPVRDSLWQAQNQIIAAGIPANMGYLREIAQAIAAIPDKSKVTPQQIMSQAAAQNPDGTERPLDTQEQQLLWSVMPYVLGTFDQGNQ